MKAYRQRVQKCSIARRYPPQIRLFASFPKGGKVDHQSRIVSATYEKAE